MKKYVSVIIDIENSRKYNIDDRNDLQRFLYECIKEINKLFTRNIKMNLHKIIDTINRT